MLHYYALTHALACLLTDSLTFSMSRINSASPRMFDTRSAVGGMALPPTPILVQSISSPSSSKMSLPTTTPFSRRLQPYMMEAATLRDGGCNPMRWRLQPYVMEAATPCDGGCNPTWMEPRSSLARRLPRDVRVASLLGAPAIPHRLAGGRTHGAAVAACGWWTARHAATGSGRLTWAPEAVARHPLGGARSGRRPSCTGPPGAP